MRLARSLVLSLVVPVTVVAAVSAHAPSAAAQEELRAQIQAVNETFAAAIAAGDAEAVAGLYTEDGWVMGPNAPTVKGREAIAAAFRAMIEMGVAKVTLTADEVHGGNRMAHEVGHYVLEGADGAHLDHGKYIVIWQRTDQGWKLHRDIYNSDMSLPE